MKKIEIIGNKNSKNKHNLIIGDNLIALEDLKSTHLNKINVIYIDPPYNTGKNNSFVYKDKMGDDAWLSFMNERLLLAKELLSNDGVIFVSIDDNMQAYLKVLMDGIFGKENFVANLPKLNTTQVKVSYTIMTTHEYILSYVKNKNNAEFKRELNTENTKFNKFDDNYAERGKYYTNILDTNGLTYQKSLDYVIEFNDKKYFPSGDKNKYLSRKTSNKNHDWRWIWSKERFEFALNNGFIEFNEERKRVYYRHYQNVKIEKVGGQYVIKETIRYKTNKSDKFMDKKYLTKKGGTDLENISMKGYFEFPKPISQVKDIIDYINNKDAIVLDFFAGSGTTAQAVMELNKEDGGSRQFIGVQLDEVRNSGTINKLLNKKDVFTRKDLTEEDIAFLKEQQAFSKFEDGEDIISIDQVTKERIRRVIEGTDSNGDKLEKVEPCPDNVFDVYIMED